MTLGINEDSLFAFARSKVSWARHRAKELEFYWDEYAKNDLMTLSVGEHPDGSGKCLKVSSAKLFPIQIAMIIGEIIHCLRSALDYSINAMIPGSTKITFPFASDRDQLMRLFSTDGSGACPTCNRGGKRGPCASIELAYPGIKDIFLDTIQPYKDGNKIIWTINKLDVREKHRAILPVIRTNRITGINASDENGQFIFNCTVLTQGYGSINIAAFRAGSDLRLDSYDKPSAMPFFNEQGLIENQPIFPFIAQGMYVTDQAIDSIEGFYSSRVT